LVKIKVSKDVLCFNTFVFKEIFSREKLVKIKVSKDILGLNDGPPNHFKNYLVFSLKVVPSLPLAHLESKAGPNIRCFKNAQ
jgi:hypothetical protein